MPPQSDEANLARIRDNQRRSRARRKEYQQELEQRVRAFEELGVEASTEVQQAARRVAEENKKLRALLQNSGISHASIEAYLRTGDYPPAAAATALAGSGSGPASTASSAAAAAASSTAASGTHAQTLDHLMVARFPAHYASPLVSSLSVSGSVGPSSPAGGSGGGGGGDGGGGAAGAAGAGGGGGSEWESSTSSPPASMRNTLGRAGAGSLRSSPRSITDSKGGKKTAAGTAAASSASSSSQRHLHSSAMMQTQTAVSAAAAGSYTPTSSRSNTAAASTTNNSSNSSSGYLSPGFGLANAAFYGLDAPSTDELQYTPNEAAFFDYSASPHYYGGSGGGGGGGSGSAMAGINEAPGAAAFYGQVPSMVSSSSSGACPACPACLSGIGCQVHGNFYEE